MSEGIVRHDNYVVNGQLRFCQVVEHGNTVYLAGQVGDPSSDVKAQTRQILEKIDSLLVKAGTSKSYLLSAMVWLTDMRFFNDMNEVWSAWIDPENPPVRACVEAKLAAPTMFVEIQVVAAKPQQNKL